jgi:hypothetical protein
VVVLMLPLAFAALVWPARRVWAARLVELLVSLVLSKFVIVAVLSLAASAFAVGTPGVGELLVAMSLILLSTFAPWALMRVLPFTELAAGAAGVLHSELSHAHGRASTAAQFPADSGETALQLPARLRDQARLMYARTGADADPVPAGMRAPDSERSSESLPQTSPVPAPQPAPAAQSPSQVADRSPSQVTTERDQGPPFVLPDAWQSSDPARLDEQLLRPTAEAEDE